MGLCERHERVLLWALLRTSGRSKVLNKAVCNAHHEVGASLMIREGVPIVYFNTSYCFLRLSRTRPPTINAVSNSNRLTYHLTLIGGLANAPGNTTLPASLNSLGGGAGTPELTTPRSVVGVGETDDLNWGEYTWNRDCGLWRE